MIEWLLVDDRADEARTFSQELTADERLRVSPWTATDAEGALAKGQLQPAGILMDVDLSNETGMRNTGPGMAQNIRMAQQRMEIPSFPIVRFSYRQRVRESIGRDSTSDDVFDLKIEKDRISDPATRLAVQRKLFGVTEVYRTVHEKIDVPELLGVDVDRWKLWGHASFETDVARTNRPYQAAAPVIRLLEHAGLLVDEDLLAIRLGVAHHGSPGWSDLLTQLEDICYHGVSGDFFLRWWARGLENWWNGNAEGSVPLAGCSIDERHAFLKSEFNGIEKLIMPAFSQASDHGVIVY